MHLIPQSWSHLHILVSVFPSVGLVFVLGFYAVGLYLENDLIKRCSLVLFGILGALAIPVYFSGDGSMAALSKDPAISEDLVNAHYGWGMSALAVLLATGAAAVFELWRSQRVGRMSTDALHLVLGLGLVTLALMVIV